MANLDSVAGQLIAEAIDALKMSHPSNPPNLRFGSAVLTAKENVYSSSAFWSDTLTLAVHAEHAALIHAAAHNDRLIKAIACVSTEDLDGMAFCHPCGICKQLIYENSRESKSEVVVFMANQNRQYTSKKISELVTLPWPS